MFTELNVLLNSSSDYVKFRKIVVVKREINNVSLYGARTICYRACGYGPHM